MKQPFPTGLVTSVASTQVFCSAREKQYPEVGIMAEGHFANAATQQHNDAVQAMENEQDALTGRVANEDQRSNRLKTIYDKVEKFEKECKEKFASDLKKKYFPWCPMPTDGDLAFSLLPNTFCSVVMKNWGPKMAATPEETKKHIWTSMLPDVKERLGNQRTNVARQIREQLTCKCAELWLCSWDHSSCLA